MARLPDLSGIPSQFETWRARLDCPFPAVQAVLADCLGEAAGLLSAAGLDAWLDCARALGKMGRGPEPVLALLQAWPQVVQTLGAGDRAAESLLADVAALLQAMQKSPNSAAMAPLLQTLPAVARRLLASDPMRRYLCAVAGMMARTTVSLHGHHATFASPGLPVLLAQAPRLLGVLSVSGLARWADYGVRHYASHPERQRDYFALQLPDSRAVLQRERHGTLLADVERQLELLLRALWQDPAPLRAYATGLEDAAAPAPWSTHQTPSDSLCLPDVYDGLNGVAGLDRYRVAVAHLAAHRRWSQPLLADNLSPLQRLTIECLEDARIDHLLLRRYPGLRYVMLALHPRPVEGACDPELVSSLRHRLAMLSRALLDPAHGYADAALNHCVAAFHALLEDGKESSTQAMQALALQHATRTRRQSDQLARVHFTDTVVSYRDDNRHLWRFIEAGDEEDSFDQPRPPAEQEMPGLPPRHYPEWDAASQSYRPDWVSLYESLHPSGDAGAIDALLARHAALARQLQQLLDRLKPQNRVRIRYQEEGSELDLDVAIRSLIDWRAGSAPDPRILMSHRTDGRSIAVLVLLDLSHSLNDAVPGSGQTRLSLSQEAVALLAWAMDRLGDPFALAGFHSNTRHDVRYQHIKGFGERWIEAPKARLAALQAQYSTRMGAALRHAAHTLGAQASDKKLLLVLTDGRPSDVDTPDDQALVADTRQAVQELAQQGIHSHCISLDPQADAYVHDIFGQHATVVDRVEQLPERLTRLFVSLTR
ncbi:vWA domain-containing protein [Polaromonas naphthalenivorans]|uniref:von Willebrand factor, type A n=1 Tax=Polaromonas naphthalenivorans (strain CJ2) TaxID=365044 RepID=A1VNQ7_POLNA|nr:nitric oxide reductase activation protein NorD [Polaromonas naphthalenivorans]ABM37285.1 von Willebrand factor, type A [Polaromonas naphthalenivorans CJ2]